MMKDVIVSRVIAPTIKAMSDLCKGHGITFVCLIEYKDGLTSDVITHNIEDDATDNAKEALKAMEGKK